MRLALCQINVTVGDIAGNLERIRTAETVGLFPSESEPPPVIARESRVW